MGETVHWIDEAFLARNCEDGNPPAIDGPHVDYYVDQSIVKPFAGYDLSAYDIVIGLWKPENMSNPVVDYPLAVMDGSTLDEDCVIPVWRNYTNDNWERKSDHQICFWRTEVRRQAKVVLLPRTNRRRSLGFSPLHQRKKWKTIRLWTHFFSRAKLAKKLFKAGAQLKRGSA